MQNDDSLIDINNSGTKERILLAASELFSEKGSDAIGVREIAQKANVNLAAINYHFQNKENLYIETIKNCIFKMKDSIEKIYLSRQNWKIEEFVLCLCEHFIPRGDEMRLSMKLLLGSEVPICDEALSHNLKIGHPGGEYVFNVFKANAPKASDEDLIWCTRIIFVQIMHRSMLMGKNWKKSLEEQCITNEEQIKKDLIRLGKTLLAEIN